VKWRTEDAGLTTERIQLGTILIRGEQVIIVSRL
jgi:hypothetical protein